jgi:hypothetical protein
MNFFLLGSGILEEKIFEADPNIKYTFAWDRMNIYRQRVYGVTTANIKVQGITNYRIRIRIRPIVDIILIPQNCEIFQIVPRSGSIK